MVAKESKSEPKFKVQVIDNGFLEDNKKQPRKPAPNKKLTFIDGSALETKKDMTAVKSVPESDVDSLQVNWNNEEYLNDIRRQILKEMPNIEKSELEKIVKQFQSQDVVSITPFSPTLSYTESPVPLRTSREHHETGKENFGVDDQKLLKKVKKIVKKTLKNRTYKENNNPIDFKMAQSQPDVSYESNLSEETLDGHLRNQKNDPKPENCTSSENEEEMSSKILNRINSLLEQQFRSLKDELKANRSSSQSGEEGSSPGPNPVPESDLDASLQTKIKTSYIPEGQYNIERVNGVRRVINRPFLSNIIDQKKFQSVFRPSPIEVDASLRTNDEKKHDATGDDEPVSNSNRVVKHSGRTNKKTDKLNFDFQDEDGRLAFGDYDSLY